MTKLCVLKQNTEFRSAYYRGKSFVHPLLIVYVRKNRLGVPRVGITTGKKLGKAVVRNRCRRLIREAFRHLVSEVGGGVDLVFVARGKSVDATYAQLEQAVLKACRQLKVIKEQNEK